MTVFSYLFPFQTFYISRWFSPVESVDHLLYLLLKLYRLRIGYWLYYGLRCWLHFLCLLLSLSRPNIQRIDLAMQRILVSLPSLYPHFLTSYYRLRYSLSVRKKRLCISRMSLSLTSRSLKISNNMLCWTRSNAFV